jgi:hypothetical protein
MDNECHRRPRHGIEALTEVAESCKGRKRRKGGKGGRMVQFGRTYNESNNTTQNDG